MDSQVAIISAGASGPAQAAGKVSSSGRGRSSLFQAMPGLSEGGLVEIEACCLKGPQRPPKRMDPT